LGIGSIAAVDGVTEIADRDLGKPVIQKPIDGGRQQEAGPVRVHTRDSPQKYDRASQLSVEILLYKKKVLAAENAPIDDAPLLHLFGHLQADRALTVFAREILRVFPHHVHILP